MLQNKPGLEPQANVQRLKTYKEKLVVFPRTVHKLKVGLFI